VSGEVAGGRVVLVTGATGILGTVVAKRFGADGARLVLVGTDQGRLASAAVDAALDGGRWLPVVADLLDPADARRAASEAVSAFERVDVLVHLVGGWKGGTPVVDLDPNELRWMLDRHLWTTLNVVQAVVPGMVERKYGRVLALSAPFAEKPAAKGASYAVAKAAEEVLLRTLAREVGGDGVTANVLVVRKIDTQRERETAPSPKNAGWALPEEIADALLFLASPEAAAINGQRIPLDGRA
jgi:NAD(P)-dependent dehydrogenase (short-subunit alcohol dehydrogenase family)